LAPRKSQGEDHHDHTQGRLAATILLLLVGCGTATTTPAPPVSSQPSVTFPPSVPVPAPSTTTLDISVTAGCQYGNTDTPSYSVGVCTTAEAAPINEAGTYGDDYANDAYGDGGQIDACQLTVTNQNSYPVSVSTVVLGFYDASGDEISDNTEALPLIQLAAGSSTQVVQGDLPSGTASCAATGWSA
jgi:hypothetical protein